MPKININGKEYDFDNSDDFKKLIQEHSGEFGNSSSVNITRPTFIHNGQTFHNFNDLPPELQEKVKQNLEKLKNPLVANILKKYGIDPNNPDTLMNNSFTKKLSDGSFNDSSFNQSGGSSFNTSSSNPMMGSTGNPMMNSTGNSPKRKNTGIFTLVMIIITIGIFVGVLIVGMNFLGSYSQTFALEGDPTHFDPIASVNEIRSHVDPNAKLSAIDMSYVRSDGTMDLTVSNYRPQTTYHFYRELAEPPKDAPPVGAGGTATGKWYEPVEADVYRPGEWRSVTKIGGGVDTEYTYTNKGIDLDVSDPTTYHDEFVDDPQCPLADLWKTAIKHGAPSDAVASVTYDKDGYSFDIYDADVYLNFGNDCQLAEDSMNIPEVAPPQIQADQAAEDMARSQAEIDPSLL